ncbi:MAG: VWA-like domain-containing protein [Bacteroidales bacterium]|nr:VWA-like domain-containing protein [Bacteroidales bacterium]
MTARERISQIAQHWFLYEEALFTTFCSHRLMENSTMQCHMRVGKGAFEFNPTRCASCTDDELQERMKVEMIRILLKHPYERQPEGCGRLACAQGSNCVVSDNYYFRTFTIDDASDFELPRDGHYEFYARQIQKKRDTDSLPTDYSFDDIECRTESEHGFDYGSNAEMAPSEGAEDEEERHDHRTPFGTTADMAENWQHDELMKEQINDMINHVQNWGSIPGSAVEQIIASTKARIDYRKVLARFRASVLSQARRLTRMRPNRRSGFDQMGSRYHFTTRLIVGVDVSASVSSEQLQHFYTTINRFFRYGIKEIDVVQFDHALGEVKSISKASPKVEVTGRGGTSFQPFVDLVARSPQYDGAIIYTDGGAPFPDIPPTMRTPLCWVITNEEDHEIFRRHAPSTTKTCVIDLPG